MGASHLAFARDTTLSLSSHPWQGGENAIPSSSTKRRPNGVLTGYAGMELARILARHPEAEITSVTGRSMAGKSIGEVFPHLAELDMTITEEITESVDVVFSALPVIQGEGRNNQRHRICRHGARPYPPTTP